MLIAAIGLGIVALGLASQTTLPEEAPPGRLSGRLGRELAGVTVFAVATLATAAGVVDVAARTTEFPPGLALLVGWVLLRALTRKDAPRPRVMAGAGTVLVALGVAEALARMLAD